MTALPCPTCGADSSFKSGAPYSVCRSCKSLLIRGDASLEALGRVAVVPDDFSPLQIGTSGEFEHVAFRVVGRLRKEWDEGSWNEWCVLFDDQRFGWLAEAQGDLVMSFAVPGTELAGGPVAAREGRATPGSVWHFHGEDFTVTDVKSVRLQGAEGELAEFFSLGEAVLCVDLRGPGLAFATAELRRGSAHVYLGRFVEFAECRFALLRRLPGWSDVV
jgi:hypothetical protein